jgi:hypothetical protein
MRKRFGKEFLAEEVELPVSYEEFRMIIDQVLGDWIQEKFFNAQAMWNAVVNGLVQ